MGFKLAVRLTTDLPDDRWGECSDAEGEIKVSSALPPQMVWSTLLHELGHFIWSRTREDGDAVGEEAFCNLLENLATLEMEE